MSTMRQETIDDAEWGTPAPDPPLHHKVAFMLVILLLIVLLSWCGGLMG